MSMLYSIYAQILDASQIRYENNCLASRGMQDFLHSNLQSTLSVGNDIFHSQLVL